jgi:hypothetical protein
MVFQVGDLIEVTVPNWIGERRGVILDTELGNYYGICINYPDGRVSFYNHIHDFSMRKLPLPDPPPPTGAGALEYEEAMSAQALME